jgi:hypothetical protein
MNSPWGVAAMSAAQRNIPGTFQNAVLGFGDAAEPFNPFDYRTMYKDIPALQAPSPTAEGFTAAGTQLVQEAMAPKEYTPPTISAPAPLANPAALPGFNIPGSEIAQNAVVPTPDAYGLARGLPEAGIEEWKRGQTEPPATMETTGIEEWKAEQDEVSASGGAGQAEPWYWGDNSFSGSGVGQPFRQAAGLAEVEAPTYANANYAGSLAGTQGLGLPDGSQSASTDVFGQPGSAGYLAPYQAPSQWPMISPTVAARLMPSEAQVMKQGLGPMWADYLNEFEQMSRIGAGPQRAQILF